VDIDRPKTVVLLVEDNATIRRLARIGIERNGLVVDEAPDGASAIKLLDDASRVYAAVVVDLGLPDIAGTDVVAHALRARPNAAVVVSSGSIVEGMDDRVVVVPKPYTPLALGAAVKKAVEARRGTPSA